MGYVTPPETISFRHLLKSVIDKFLAAEGMGGAATTEAVGELLVTLARYHEEGAALFPLVFLCDDRGAMLAALGGVEAVVVGEGPASAETALRAVKVCAPLGKGGWSIFIERRRETFGFGVFRADGFVLRDTPLGLMRRMADPTARLIGVVPIAENVLELRGGSGAARLVYLSGARSEAPPWDPMMRLTYALVRDVPESLRTAVQSCYKRLFLDVMRAPHGALVAVLPPGVTSSPLFVDGAMLARPLSVADAVGSYLETGGESERARVEALSSLLLGMISSDGITVLGSDGTIVGFNQFVHLGPQRGRGPIGGARRRTYEALAERVGGALLAAFYRSQDGAAECVVAPG